MFFVFFYSVLFQFSALMSDTAVSQGLLFAFATCLMLTSEYYFSLLSFVNAWEVSYFGTLIVTLLE